MLKNLKCWLNGHRWRYGYDRVNRYTRFCLECGKEERLTPSGEWK